MTQNLISLDGVFAVPPLARAPEEPALSISMRIRASFVTSLKVEFPGLSMEAMPSSTI